MTENGLIAASVAALLTASPAFADWHHGGGGRGAIAVVVGTEVASSGTETVGMRGRGLE